jgi:hypothetical protein
MAVVIAPAADPVKPAQKSSPQRTLRVPLSSTAEAIGPEDLKAILDNGKRARVLRLRTAKDDLLLLAVLDLVGDLSLVDAARNSLIEQIKALPKKTWVALLRAQNGLQVILDPTSDRDALEAAIRGMPIAGKAGLLDTVETAARLADSIGGKSALRVAVLYITDSDVRNYREDFTNPVINSSDSRDLSRRFPEGLIRERIARSTETVGRSQTPVFIVHLSYSSERLNQAYQSGLMKLASETGGAAVFCRSQAEIPDMIAQTVASIQTMQQAWVQLPPKPPAMVNLTVEANGRSVGQRSRFLLK